MKEKNVAELIESDPKEAMLQLKEEAKWLKGEINELLKNVYDAYPRAIWSDSEAPAVGDPGISGAFLNSRNEAIEKLKEACRLLERGLKHF